METMRIGIDGEALRKPLAGVGQYVFNLCREIEHLLPQARFFVYARLDAAQLALPSERWTLRREPRSWLRKLPSFLWLRTRGAALCRRDKLDLFWAGRTLHAGRSAARKTIVTVHDLNHRIVPETMERATLWSHRCWFDADVRSADVVVANSDGTSRRLVQWIGRAADSTVRPGLSPAFLAAGQTRQTDAVPALAAHGIVRPYLLAVSTLEPRKNIDALLDAYLALRASGQLAGHSLVLVGARGWQNERLAERLHAAPGVVLPGYIPDTVMPLVYAQADALVMMSLYEGFGMPVQEACAMGTPVVIADVDELREAAHGRCTVAQHNNPASLQAAILQAMAQPVLVPDWPAHAAWQHGAQAMAKLFRTQHATLRA